MATRHLAAKSTSWSILAAQAGVDGGGRLTVRRTAAPVGRERVVVKVWGAARPLHAPHPPTHSGLAGTAPTTSPGPGAGESWRQGGQVRYQQMVESRTKMRFLCIKWVFMGRLQLAEKPMSVNKIFRILAGDHNRSENSSFQLNTCY